MQFVNVRLQNAAGAILAHNIFDAQGRRLLRKGTVIAERDIELLRQTGVSAVYVARLEPGDLHEDQAAGRIASSVQGPGTFVPHAATGRANVKAEVDGLLKVDRPAVEQINRLEPGITLATLRSDIPVRARQLVATVKIIPFAVRRSAVEQVERLFGAGSGVIRVLPFRVQRAGVIATSCFGDQERVLRAYLPALQTRLQKLGAVISQQALCAHEPDALAAAIEQVMREGCELIMIVSMTAIIDRRDVVPDAVERAGGRIEHYGVPVDPGNLLLLAYRGNMAIIGVPGCARSLKFNALDMILPRLVAGESITSEDLLGLGYGGLLEEIRERRLLRDENDTEA